MGPDPEVRLPPLAVAYADGAVFVRELHDPRDAEGCQRLVVEGQRARQVSDGYADVVEHAVRLARVPAAGKGAQAHGGSHASDHGQQLEF